MQQCGDALVGPAHLSILLETIIDDGFHLRHGGTRGHRQAGARSQAVVHQPGAVVAQGSDEFGHRRQQCAIAPGLDARNRSRLPSARRCRSRHVDDSAYRRNRAVGFSATLHRPRRHWSTASPIRAIFQHAFHAAGLRYFNPHSFRNTLVQLEQALCRDAAQFRAWSQNRGHERVPTTFLSNGAVAPPRHGQINQSLVMEGGQTPAQADVVAQVVVQAMRGAGLLGGQCRPPRLLQSVAARPKGIDELPSPECQIKVTKSALGRDRRLAVGDPLLPFALTTRASAVQRNLTAASGWLRKGRCDRRKPQHAAQGGCRPL